MAMFHHGPEQEYNLTTLKSHHYQQHASLGLVKPKMKRDAKDPHFFVNLNRLGPVRFYHHMQTIKT
ncbi:hypothetical protein BGW80DRAFT_836014 [Lactifluus volemus]|nr:hypothetical protein BGW80DRAFT_836014 [Lactifluus volemus]